MRWVAAARQASKGITTTEQIQTSADRLIDFVERVLIGKRGYVAFSAAFAFFSGLAERN